MKRLTRADLARFCRALARRLPCPVRVVLTGGGEAMLLGGVRPTGDLDFQLVVSERWKNEMSAIEAALAAAAAETGVVIQYGTDIDRWSSVSIPPRRRRSRALRRLGRLSVHLLDPGCWAVYKLSRYLEGDREDLRAVLPRERIAWRRLATLAGEALRTSPRSTQLILFRRQVEHFFHAEGRTIWGPGFDAAHAISVFHEAARVPRT